MIIAKLLNPRNGNFYSTPSCSFSLSRSLSLSSRLLCSILLGGGDNSQKHLAECENA